MPVQINEMTITVEVESSTRQNTTAAQPTGAQQENQTKKLIEECLDQVMEVMRNKNER